MKTLISNDKATIAALAERLKRAQSQSEYQRIQCVLIRATLGSTAKEIAQLLGWATSTVYVIHSRWAKEGEAIFDLRARGGRHNQHLTSEQEADLLAPFIKLATGGEMLHVSEIKKASEARVGAAIAASTVYRMLNRHGWRKVVPRPRHPKADFQAQTAFKKTAQSGAPGGRAPG
jgi:transposase